MPYCSQCGNQVGPADAYCGRCGASQPVGTAAGHAGAGKTPFSDISPRTASILCYIPGIGWVAAILVLAAERFRADRVVRFHAFQGLYLFVAWLINQWVIEPFSGPFGRFQLHNVIGLILLIMSIVMIVKAAHEQRYSLPLFGELAERSVAED